MAVVPSNLPSLGSNSGSTGIQPARSATADDVLDLLRDDTPTDKPADKTDKTKDKVGDNPDDDIDLKDDSDKDDKLNLDDEEDEQGKDKDKDKDKDKTKGKKDEKEETLEDELDAPPKKRELLTKYPDIFKTFPWFEKMIYRDRQYTELFGSFDDAKEVAEQAQILNNFEKDLISGNTETILKQVKENDPKAFDKIVDNYMGALAKVDKEAYVEVCGNIGKHIIRDIVAEAKNVQGMNKEQAELLHQTALVLNQYLFGSSTYTPPKARVEAKTNEEEERLNQEKTNFNRERYEASKDELQTRVDNTLRATITDYIDRNNEMSSYVKKNAINDAMRLLHSTIGNDAAFRKNLDKLWEASFNDRFSQNSLGRIKSAYLGRAKALLKPIIAKARAEALKDNTPVNRERDDDKEEQEERPNRRGPISSGRPRQSSGKNERKPGESVSEFFARD